MNQEEREEKLEQRLALRITKSEKEAFMNKVKNEGRNPSQVLLSLVRQYLNDQDERLASDERIAKLEEQITSVQRQLGELCASGMKTAS